VIKLGILVSGRGSNMVAIHRAIANGQLQATISVVISNNPQAPAVGYAQKNTIPVVVLSPRDGESRKAHEAAMVQILQTHGVDWVILAGYMALLRYSMLEAFAGRMINIHPSLLPSFKGLNAQQQALDYGVKIAGCTVHYVTSDMDSGPIIAQAAVPVLDTDTVTTLSERILAEEHRLLPQVIQGLQVLNTLDTTDMIKKQ
jgi:phosphoribosylglycinamide formyltransferase-1